MQLEHGVRLDARSRHEGFGVIVRGPDPVTWNAHHQLGAIDRVAVERTLRHILGDVLKELLDALAVAEDAGHLGFSQWRVVHGVDAETLLGGRERLLELALRAALLEVGEVGEEIHLVAIQQRRHALHDVVAACPAEGFELAPAADLVIGGEDTRARVHFVGFLLYLPTKCLEVMVGDDPEVRRVPEAVPRLPDTDLYQAVRVELVVALLLQHEHGGQGVDGELGVLLGLDINARAVLVVPKANPLLTGDGEVHGAGGGWVVEERHLLLYEHAHLGRLGFEALALLDVAGDRLTHAIEFGDIGQCGVALEDRFGVVVGAGAFARPLAALICFVAGEAGVVVGGVEAGQEGVEFVCLVIGQLILTSGQREHALVGDAVGAVHPPLAVRWRLAGVIITTS